MTGGAVFALLLLACNSCIEASTHCEQTKHGKQAFLFYDLILTITLLLHIHVI